MRLLRSALFLALLWPALNPVEARAGGQLAQADDLVMQQQAAPFLNFADQILAAVTTGQSGALRASLSPSTMAAWEEGDVDVFVDEIVMPFFADYDHPVNEQWVAPTTSPSGLTGFAFYRSFATKSGDTKPYVLYLLEEDGRMVVGNLLVGRTFEDMHPQQ